MNPMRQDNMKLLNYLTVASVFGRAVAVDANLCPGYHDLNFNSTNIANLAPCSQLNYVCRDSNGRGQLMEYDSTTGPAPANCEHWGWNIFVDKTVAGSISIPDVVNAVQVVSEGQWGWWDYMHNITTPDYPLNITSLERPDLVNVGGVFTIRLADKIESLKVPKLTNISSYLYLDLTGASSPAIDLSFPSLYHVEGEIWMSGNIDSVDLPSLNYSANLNITSTGNLDCIALATKVVNSNNPFYRSYSDGAGNNSFVYNSRKGNITTSKATPKNSAMMMEVSWGLIALVGVMGWFGYLL